MNNWFSKLRCKDTGSLLRVLPLECLMYFKPLKCAHIFFAKSHLSILGNLSCKLCRDGRGGASLHNFNFFVIHTLHIKENEKNK